MTEFTQIRSEVFELLNNDKNNLQECSGPIIEQLTPLINKDNTCKNEAEFLINLVFRYIELERDDWKRVRSAIEHENNLTNNRITWLISSQAFLFTALTFTFNAWANPNSRDILELSHNLYPLLMGIIALTGMISCWLTYQALSHGRYQLKFLDNWWHYGKDWDKVIKMDEKSDERNIGRKVSSKSHPPLQGSLKFIEDNFLHTDFMPIYFIIIWGTIICFMIIFYVFPELMCPKKIIQIAFASFIIVSLISYLLSLLFAKYRIKAINRLSE